MNVEFKIPVNPESDYLKKYAEILPTTEIFEEREKRNKFFAQKGTQIYYPILKKTKDIKTKLTDFSQMSVKIGDKSELNAENQEKLISSAPIISK